VKISSDNPGLTQSLRYNHHASALPDSTFDNISLNLVLDDVLDTPAQCKHSLWASHGEGTNESAHLLCSLIEVGWKRWLVIGRFNSGNVITGTAQCVPNDSLN
jgi:hypothetical protein